MPGCLMRSFICTLPFVTPKSPSVQRGRDAYTVEMLITRRIGSVSQVCGVDTPSAALRSIDSANVNRTVSCIVNFH
jgi:hypothetical protein